MLKVHFKEINILDKKNWKIIAKNFKLFIKNNYSFNNANKGL